MATTIDITPTGEEVTRIYAYILANHAELSPHDFGDYWNYTEAETESIRKAFSAFDQLRKALELAGLDLTDVSQSFRTKFIKSALKTAKAGN